MSLGNATLGRPGARLALVAGIGALLLGAAPARAGGGFHQGFENELGRLAARGVVRAGRLVLLRPRSPYFAARWAGTVPAPGYEVYGAYPPPPPPPRGYPAPVYAPSVYPSAAPVYAPPVYPSAAPVYAPPVYPSAAPVYAPPVYPTAAPVYSPPPPPSAAAPCQQSSAGPYEEHIIWERYERVIQRPTPPPDPDPYQREVRY
jgi:hypothetical protein